MHSSFSPGRRALVQAFGASLGAGVLGAQAQSQGRVWRIAEIKMVSHAALDGDQRGFAAGLAAAGFPEGERVVFERHDAQGHLEQVKELTRRVAQGKFDLVHTIATLPSQEMLRTGSTTPLVFSSVTDPVSAGLVGKSAMGQKTRTHVTGVSDLWPVDLQFLTYSRMVPQAKVWGTIYNPTEANSVTHLARMHEAAQRLGLQLLEVQVRSGAEVEAAAQSLVGKVQAITITSDNTTVSRMEALARVCNAHRIALFAGDTDSVAGGAVAAYGLDYYLVGYAAGRKAALILKGVKPGEVPWGPMEKFRLVINRKAAEAQGVVLSPELLAKADQVLS